LYYLVGFHDGSDHMHRDVGVGWVKLPVGIVSEEHAKKIRERKAK